MLRKLGLLGFLTVFAVAMVGCGDDKKGGGGDDDGGSDGADDGDLNDGGGDDAAADASDGLTTLALNSELGTTAFLVWSAGDDDSPRAAARIETGGAFEVREIVYRMANVDLTANGDFGVNCDATLEHGVALAQGVAANPPGNGNPGDAEDNEDVLVTVNEDTDGVTRTNTTTDGASMDNIPSVEFHVTLDTPYQVTEGNDLYVMIHQAVDNDTATCLFAADGSVATRNFNSYNTEDPIAWKRLRMFLGGDDADLQVEARGIAGN